jgi:DNA-binding NtrC family response regulator
VRELKNAIERAILFCAGDEIRPEFIQFSPLMTVKSAGARKSHRFLKISMEEIKRLMEKHRGRAKDVAGELDISPRTLYYHIRRMGKSITEARK